MPRMDILDKNSFYEFQKPPEFSSSQRKSYFEFSNKLITFVKKLRSPCNQIGFLLSFGYFKASKRFYDPCDFNIRDIDYVTRFLDYDNQAFQPENYVARTRQDHQLKITKLFGFKKFDILYKKKINAEIITMVRQYLKPKLVFWRCIDIMISDKVSLPTYYRIQNLILSNIAEYKSELNSIIKNNLTNECRKILDKLFSQEPDSNKYRLTLLKKPSQSITPMKIRNKVADMTLLAELYGHITPILQQLALTTEGIRYFSYSVIKTKTHHLLRREQSTIDLHLIAFIAHQYYCLQDNFADKIYF